MTKTMFALGLAAMLAMSTGFAAENACCGGDMQAKSQKASCMNFAALHLNAEQQKKLTAWQDQCMKDGCTKETREAFLKKARTILSKDQFAQLKSECDKNMGSKS